MAYSTSTIIQGLLAQFTLGASSKPTDTQIGTIIAEVDADLNVALAGQGIVVPVTTPAYYVTWLEGVSAAGSAARVLKSMFPNTTGAGETPAYAFWQKIYTDALAGIKSGAMIPPDAISGGTRFAPTTYFTRNPDEEEDLGIISEPFFHRGRPF